MMRPAVGVVLRVGGGDQEHVEGQAHLVAADLHVAFLEHVQEPHLDAFGEVGQFVDGEDAAIDPRHETEVDGQFIVEIAALGHLDRVDLADQVRNRDVGGGELFGVAFGTRQPGDGGVVAGFLDDGAAFRRDRIEGVFRYFGTLDDGYLVVEQVGEAAHHAGLRLAAFAQHHDVLTAEYGVGDLRDHRLVVADDSREEGIPAPQLGDEIAAHLGLDAEYFVAGALEFAQCRRLLAHGASRRGTPSSVAVRTGTGKRQARLVCVSPAGAAGVALCRFKAGAAA